MIEIFTTIGNNGLRKIEEIEKSSWIRVVDPTREDLDKLVKIGLPADFLTYALDDDEIPRVEKEDDGTTLILIRTPYYRGEEYDIPYVTSVLGVIFFENKVVTISRRRNDILESLIGTKIRGFSTVKRNRFLLQILLSTAKQYLGYLRQINEKVDSTEDSLQKSLNNKEVLDLLKFQKSLVYFETGLRTNQVMMEKLDRMKMLYEFEEDEDLLDDVLTENKQAREMVMISSSILSSMMDAYASIISNNLNDVMKVLTSVTIILSLPTMVTSFFGMNVDLPFTQIPHTYWIILGICVLLMIVTLLYFIWRKWF
ncbi:MAG: magnesium transporter CorA family protein [Anaerolineaceae bacterium]